MIQFYDWVHHFHKWVFNLCVSFFNNHHTPWEEWITRSNGTNTPPHSGRRFLSVSALRSSESLLTGFLLMMSQNYLCQSAFVPIHNLPSYIGKTSDGMKHKLPCSSLHVKDVLAAGALVGRMNRMKPTPTRDLLTWTECWAERNICTQLQPGGIIRLSWN